jgi:hypothetical protein
MKDCYDGPHFLELFTDNVHNCEKAGKEGGDYFIKYMDKVQEELEKKDK